VVILLGWPMVPLAASSRWPLAKVLLQGVGPSGAFFVKNAG